MYRVLDNPEQTFSPFPEWRVVHEDERTYAVAEFKLRDALLAVAFRENMRLWEAIWGHDLDSVNFSDGILTLVTLTHDEGNTLTDRDFMLANAASNVYAMMPSETKG